MAGKKYRKALEGYDHTKKYTVAEGCAVLAKTKISSKWDETVDVSIRLGPRVCACVLRIDRPVTLASI